MNRHGVDLAVARIELQWRTTLYRQPLIDELTALDWHARTMDDQPVDEDLLDRIGLLRSRIWLSHEN